MAIFLLFRFCIVFSKTEPFRRGFIASVLVFLMSQVGFAQLCYTVPQTKACAPFTVTVHECSQGTSKPQYQYVANGPFTDDTTYTYTTPGIYPIVQRANYQQVLDYNKDTIYIEVKDPNLTPNATAELCKGRQAILNLTNGGFDQYQINWGDGSPVTSVNSVSGKIAHTYPDQNPRNISLTGVYYSGNTAVCQVNKTLPTTYRPFNAVGDPQLSQVLVNTFDRVKGQLVLSFTASQFLRYQVFTALSGSGSFTLSGTDSTGSGPAQDTIKGLNTLTNTYCVYIQSEDGCNNISPSPTVCTPNLLAVNSGGAHNITWPGLPKDSLDKIEVYSGNMLLQTLPGSANFYSDTSYNCCYMVKAYYSHEVIPGISYQACVEGQPGILPILNGLNSSVVNGSAVLIWKPSSARNIQYYQVYSSTTNGLTELDSTISTSYTDNHYNQNQTACYQVTESDQCHNTSPFSKPTCVPVLSLKISGVGNVLISSPGYTGDYNTISYYIEKPGTGQLIPVQPNPDGSISYSDIEGDSVNQAAQYRLVVVLNGDPSQTYYSAYYEITQPMRMALPNAFSPNEDGLNDVFKAKTVFVKEFNFQVFNRWGQLLFVTRNVSDGWDGKGAEPGVYSYYAEASDGSNRIRKTGTVTLVK